MISDKLVTLPNSDTVTELLAIMGGSPFDYTQPGAWHLSIFTSKEPMLESVPKNNVFRVKPITSELWYDSQASRTNLVIVFESQDVINRHDQLKGEGIESVFDYYTPHLTLVYGFPTLSRANKSFKDSITMSLRSTPHPFIFEGEYLVDSQGVYPNREGMEHFVQRNS